MKYKNILFTLLLVIGLFFLVSFANAEETTTSDDVTPTQAVSSGEGEVHKLPKLTPPLQRKLLNDITNLKNSKDEKRSTIGDLKKSFGTLAGHIEGTVTAINGTSFTVKKNDKTMNITTDSTTKCVRHYFGDCTISEIAVNDKVQVFGGYTDETHTTLQATLVRDASIMKKFGSFVGNVFSKGDNTFVLQSKERGQQSITITTTTKFIQRNEKPSTFADMQVGDRVRVKGVWDKVNNTVALVSEVKDYSIPVVKRVPTTALSPVTSTETGEETPTVSPTEAVSPTVTPSATTQ